MKTSSSQMPAATADPRREGEQKLAGGASHRTDAPNERAPERAQETAGFPPSRAERTPLAAKTGGLRHRLFSAGPPGYSLAVLFAWFALFAATFPNSAHAQYPLRASLFPGEQQPGGQHGFSAAADATYVAVGAPLTAVAGVQNVGVVVVYDAATGARVRTLTNPTPASGDQFGYAVAVSGSRVLVGARYDDAGATDAGAAYLYDLTGATPGVPIETLSHPAAVNGHFGRSVALSGQRALVGSSNPAAAYLYDLGTSAPVPQPITGTGTGFGATVALSGNRAVIGAPSATSSSVPGAGLAHVFDVSIAPPTLLRTLNNPSPGLNDHFGDALAIDGTRIVIGASLDDPNFSSNAGSAYVYDLASATPAIPVVTLPNPAPATDDQFGAAVSIAGTKVLIGAGFDGTGNTASDIGNRGTAWLYDLAGAAPVTPLHTFLNPAPATNDYFGGAVALAGTRAVIGAPGDDAPTLDTGAATLYDVTTPSVPTTVAALIPALNPNPEFGGYFGNAVAVDGNLMVVGALFADVPGAPNAGKATVYDLSSATPTVPIAVLSNPSPDEDDCFGVSVAVHGTKVVVGAYSDDTAAPNGGAAYVYDLAGANPAVPIRTLLNPSTNQDELFGNAVAISGDLVVVGANLAYDGGFFDAGRAYVYDLTSATPTVPRATLASPTPEYNGIFGFDVAIVGRRILVGAPHQTVNGVQYAGAAHVFDLPVSGPATLVTTLKKANPVYLDTFGISVALSASRAVVGANGDDTGTTDGGAAYVFDLTQPLPLAPIFTLTSPTARPLGEFGRSVGITALSRVLVGAYREGGAGEPGRAYVFDLDGPTPTSPATLSSPTPDAGDEFGFAVAISGNRLVVGAPADDTLNESAGAAYVFGGALGPAEIVVEQPAGNPLTDNASSVSFGAVALGQSSSRTFTVRNTGLGELALFGVIILPSTSEFSASLPVPPPVLPPGASLSFTVTFTPTTAGPKVATLQLGSSDADENPFRIGLSATALTRLESWRQLHFGSIANAGPGADTNDYDFDGLPNLLEFALLRNPTLASIPQEPIHVFTREPLPPDPMTPLARERLKLTYTRAKAAVLDGLAFVVDWTPDLTALWNTNVPEMVVGDDGIVQTVEASVVVYYPEGEPRARFMRLRVSRP